MQFERLLQDFTDVQRRLGIHDPIEIPRMNVTEGRPTGYRDFYNAEATGVIERIFAADLERVGYRF